MGTTATFLRARFACTDAEVIRVGGKLPPDIDPALAGDVVNTLQSRFLLSEEELRKLALGSPVPMWLGSSYEANIEPSLASLQSRLSLSEAELRKLVIRAPVVICRSVETMIEPSLKALQERLTLSDAELKKLVLGLPAVLGFSYETNLGPKLNYLQSTFRLSPDIMKSHVLTCPALLAYSLDQRYRPRIALASSLGVVAARAQRDEMLFPAGKHTDAQFMAWLRRREKLALSANEWASLCALPITEREAAVRKGRGTM